MSWIRVSKQSPCMACGHGDWCLNGDDGESSLCMRVTSQRPYPMASGETGYIHKFTSYSPAVHLSHRQVKKPVKKYINARTLFNDAMFYTCKDDVADLAGDLGVTLDSLMQIGCAWFPNHQAWGFPMKDGNHNIIGVRLRNKSGRKWAIEGSKSGIFYSQAIPPLKAFIMEGPTDTAAAISCGLFAIGRPSCSSGVHEILQLIRTCRTIHEVIIISDNDGPGRNGALALQKLLKVKSCVVTLPCKDMREFHKIGGNAEMIDYIVADTVWFNPEWSDTSTSTR